MCLEASFESPHSLPKSKLKNLSVTLTCQKLDFESRPFYCLTSAYFFSTMFIALVDDLQNGNQWMLDDPAGILISLTPCMRCFTMRC